MLSGSNNTASGVRFFRCFLYGRWHSRRSTTAAHFGTPKDVRIIMTRHPEQLIPVTDEGYKHKHCPEKAQIVEALTAPEKLFGTDWANSPERTLVLDDISYFRELVDEDVSTDDKGRTITDSRRIGKLTKQVMWNALCRQTMAKPQHFICIAVEDEYTEELPPFDRWIYPSLPPKVRSLVVGPDFEYVFYVNTDRVRGKEYKLLTDGYYTTRTYRDEKTRTDYQQRTTFQAKNKVPYSWVGRKPPLIDLWEEMDLRRIWTRIRTGRR